MPPGPREAVHMEVGSTLADGRYELTSLLGKGGMATVWAARDHRLGVDRAVKIMTPAFRRSEALMRRFEREARLMAQLEHPNICAVHDIVTGPDEAWLVMPLLVGGSLKDRLDTEGPFGPRAACAITIAVLDALALAHAHGIVHRDVKPHNVLLDAAGHPRLTDFGIAMDPTDTGLTRTGSLMGTWAYMAPEQRHSAKNVDHRADLYAVGAMLAQLVTGREPQDLHSEDAQKEQLADVDPRLAAFIGRCTRYQPADRFPDARKAIDALRGVLEGFPDDTRLWSEAETRILKGIPPTDPHATHETLLAYLDDGSTSRDAPATLVPEVAAADPPPADPDAPTVLAAVAPDPPATRGPLVAVGLVLLLLTSALAAGGVMAVAAWTAGDPTVARSTPAPLPEPLERPAPEEAHVPVPVPLPGPAPEPAPVRRPVPSPAVEAPVQRPAPPAPEPVVAAVPAPPEPPPTPAGPTGTLRINSRPQEARVTIDGRDAGRTPQTLEVPVGSHRIRVTPESGEPITRTLQVDEGARVPFCWDFGEGGPC
ncbi:MAG: serine/threonine protein kinase [Alphaproteobacteria bacterium]|nr:serine/threonine protein kinase [Alphaproteobacteria bacterium]